MTIEESGNHCAGCGAGIRSYLDELAKTEKEANELSAKDKIAKSKSGFSDSKIVHVEINLDFKGKNFIKSLLNRDWQSSHTSKMKLIFLSFQ